MSEIKVGENVVIEREDAAREVDSGEVIGFYLDVFFII